MAGMAASVACSWADTVASLPIKRSFGYLPLPRHPSWPGVLLVRALPGSPARRQPRLGHAVAEPGLPGGVEAPDRRLGDERVGRVEQPYVQHRVVQEVDRSRVRGLALGRVQRLSAVIERL